MWSTNKAIFFHVVDGYAHKKKMTFFSQNDAILKLACSVTNTQLSLVVCKLYFCRQPIRWYELKGQVNIIMWRKLLISQWTIPYLIQILIIFSCQVPGWTGACSVVCNVCSVLVRLRDAIFGWNIGLFIVLIFLEFIYILFVSTFYMSFYRIKIVRSWYCWL